MTDPLVLYSTNTWIAYAIAERFYASQHYVWCTPDFDARAQASVDRTVPPTSCPAEIYRNLFEEATRGDRHSAKIDDNRTGLLRGATVRHEEGTITASQLRDIVSIVEQAQLRDFRPLLYVIPFHGVRDMVREVPVADRAAPLSREYLIDRLPRASFDLIELPLGGC